MKLIEFNEILKIKENINTEEKEVLRKKRRLKTVMRIFKKNNSSKNRRLVQDAEADHFLHKKETAALRRKVLKGRLNCRYLKPLRIALKSTEEQELNFEAVISITFKPKSFAIEYSDKEKLSNKEFGYGQVRKKGNYLMIIEKEGLKSQIWFIQGESELLKKIKMLIK